MSYSTIDPPLNRWSEKNNIELKTKFNDEDWRFFYIWKPNGSCFQFSILPVNNGVVVLEVFLVESTRYLEYREHIEFDIDALESELDKAVKRINFV